MEYYTAKTYENYEKLSEPFQKGDKWYITVRLKNGNAKDVRAYLVSPASTSSWNARKHLGFGEKGYIHIFSNASNYEEFFEKYQFARFHRLWAWYVVSDEPLPDTLPGKVRAHILPWEYVGKDDNTLRTDDEVFAGVQRALKDPALTISTI